MKTSFKSKASEILVHTIARCRTEDTSKDGEIWAEALRSFNTLYRSKLKESDPKKGKE